MHSAAKTPLLVGMLVAWFTAAGVLGYDRVDLADDLAEFVNNPVRLLHGELPYRDFWLLHPPGEVFLPAAVYRLGYGVNAVLVLNVGISVLAGLTAFWVGRMMSGRELDGALVAILVYFAGVPAEYIGYVYLHAYLVCLLAAAGMLGQYFKGHRRRYLFFAGMAVGFGFLFRSYLTGAAAVALLATVLLEARRRQLAWSGAVGLMAVYSSGILLVLAGMSLWLFDLLPGMWHAVVIDSISHAARRRLAYGHYVVESWTDFVTLIDACVHVPTSASAIFYLAVGGSDLVKTVTMHVAPFLAITFWWYHRRRGPAIPEPGEWMVLFFLLWGSLTLIRPLTRGGHSQQLSQAVTPLFFVLVFLLRPIWGHWRATKTFGAGLVAWAALAALVGVAHRAVTVSMQQAVVTIRHKSHSVAAPYGTLAFNDQKRAAELQGLIAAVLENAAEEDHVFVIPWNAPAIYALTRRRNPTYYDSTIDLLYRPSDEKQRQVCDALLAKETRLIIGTVELRGAGWDPINKRERLPLIDACIEKHYERFRESGRFCVYRRRAAKTGSAAESIDGPDP